MALASAIAAVRNNPLNFIKAWPWIWGQSSNYSKSAEEILGLNKPKRPVNAYVKFSSQLRPMLLEKNPAASISTITKLAAKHWEQLDFEVKSNLHKEYEKEMKEYNKMMEAYNLSLTVNDRTKIQELQEKMSAAKEKKKLKKKIKDLGKPKKPMSSYFLFCQTEVHKLADMGIKKFQEYMKEKWSKLPEVQRKEWQLKAKQLMETYHVSYNAWEKEMIKQGVDVSSLNKRGPRSSA